VKDTIVTAAVLLTLALLFAFAANDFKVPWVGPPAHGSDWCDAHQVELSKCEKCNPRLARGGTVVVREREPKEGECPNTLVRITLPPGVAERVGLDPQPVDYRTIGETIRANAETQYPPSGYARVAPRLPGVIREPKVILGQQVEKGAVLALLESPDFGRAKSDYLQAIAVLNLRQKTHDQEKALYEKKITAGRELLEAATRLEEAKLAERQAAQKLATLGLSAEQIEGVKKKEDTSALLEVTAPFAGMIVETSAVPGETSTPEKPIFGLAATDRLWIAIDVYEPDLPKFEKDQRVFFTVEGLPDRRFPGKVVAIGGEVDDRTRTVRVFAEVKNVQGLLRSKMFGRATVTVKPPEKKLIVPKEAVQNDGDCYLVFVSPVTNVFQARKIQIGTVYEGGYEVAGGLAAGEKIVTRGSFLLKTEVLRGQMGAG